jgi:hypothetical protein
MLGFIVESRPRCGVLKLTQAGTKGALKYDEWEKEDSRRIKMRLSAVVTSDRRQSHCRLRHVCDSLKES